jgi:hypothetical protein
MANRFAPGDPVQTPHGKGVVREVRNNRRLLVQVQERAMVVAEQRDEQQNVKQYCDADAFEHGSDLTERTA